MHIQGAKTSLNKEKNALVRRLIFYVLSAEYPTLKVPLLMDKVARKLYVSSPHTKPKSVKTPFNVSKASRKACGNKARMI